MSSKSIIAACAAVVVVPLTIATSTYIALEAGEQAELRLIQQVEKQSILCAFDVICRSTPIDSYNQLWVDSALSALYQAGNTVGASDLIAAMYENKYFTLACTGGGVVLGTAVIDVLEHFSSRVCRLINLLSIGCLCRRVQPRQAGPLDNATPPGVSTFVEQLDQTTAKLTNDLKSSILLLLAYARLQQFNTKQ